MSGKCSPGEFSKTGLEPCHLCPKSYYQIDEMSTACLPCPFGKTTTFSGATGTHNCSRTKLQFFLFTTHYYIIIVVTWFIIKYYLSIYRFWYKVIRNQTKNRIWATYIKSKSIFSVDLDCCSEDFGKYLHISLAIFSDRNWC